jgi:hypothetical protein
VVTYVGTPIRLPDFFNIYTTGGKPETEAVKQVK